MELHKARELAQNRPLCGDWCLCMALHTCSGACYYWIGLASDWLGKLSLNWPVMCRAGCSTLLYHTVLCCTICQLMSVCLC